MGPYSIIIAFCIIVILSFFFNWVSSKTNIPSVLMLIGLGMGINAILKAYGHSGSDFGINVLLEILGNVGLVMIVLEASLDLELHRNKLRLLLLSMLVATVCFSGTMFSIGYLFQLLFPSSSYYTCLIYAVPLSIMSSAIIIPSIGVLQGKKKEFMIYESTFSDIIGIMVFYFMMGAEGMTDKTAVAMDIAFNVLLTVALSVLSVFLLVLLIQRITMKVKLFLIIALLLLLFALGKQFHLSSLLMILIFGLVLNNTSLFFRGKLSKYFREDTISSVVSDFHTLTLESAFLIRTFFFVLFGFSIALSSLYSWKIALYGLAITGLCYTVRFISLRILAPAHVLPELFIAPRGLITILLYFSILKNPAFNIPEFDAGLLLYPILITSLIMTVGLLTHKGKKVSDALVSQLPGFNLKDNETKD